MTVRGVPPAAYPVHSVLCSGGSGYCCPGPDWVLLPSLSWSWLGGYPSLSSDWGTLLSPPPKGTVDGYPLLQLPTPPTPPAPPFPPPCPSPSPGKELAPVRRVSRFLYGRTIKVKTLPSLVQCCCVL